MSVVNTEYFSAENKRLAGLINDLGELLSSQDFKAYEEIILLHVCIHNKQDHKELSEREQKEFLLKIYDTVIDKFKKINF